MGTKGGRQKKKTNHKKKKCPKVTTENHSGGETHCPQLQTKPVTGKTQTKSRQGNSENGKVVQESGGQERQTLSQFIIWKEQV